MLTDLRYGENYYGLCCYQIGQCTKYEPIYSIAFELNDFLSVRSGIPKLFVPVVICINPAVHSSCPTTRITVIELLFGLVEAVFVASRSEELGIAT